MCKVKQVRYVFMCAILVPLLQDRPAFGALKDFMSEVIPPEMKSTKNFAAEGKLSVNEGDVIIILSGKAEHHWWKGQNKRTCQVGEFPRNIICSLRPICGDDIRWETWTGEPE